MDDNAEKLAKRVAKSEINLRNTAISDFQKMNRILDTCPLCHHEDTNTPPVAPIVSLGTRVYLTLPTEPDVSEGGACIIPTQHRVNLLECDDDEWEEIRVRSTMVISTSCRHPLANRRQNFMKCLTRMYHDQGRDVIFYENAAQPQRRRHAAMQAVPLPFELGGTAPAYFKEAILSADEEWTQHKKLIDTAARARDGLGTIPLQFVGGYISDTLPQENSPSAEPLQKRCHTSTYVSHALVTSRLLDISTSANSRARYGSISMAASGTSSKTRIVGRRAISSRERSSVACETSRRMLSSGRAAGIVMTGGSMDSGRGGGSLTGPGCWRMDEGAVGVALVSHEVSGTIGRSSVVGCCSTYMLCGLGQSYRLVVYGRLTIQPRVTSPIPEPETPTCLSGLYAIPSSRSIQGTLCHS